MDWRTEPLRIRTPQDRARTFKTVATRSRSLKAHRGVSALHLPNLRTSMMLIALPHLYPLRSPSILPTC